MSNGRHFIQTGTLPCRASHLEKRLLHVTEENTELLLDRWSQLTDLLDLHAKKWHERDEHGDWCEVSFQRVGDLLSRLGIEDPAEVVRQFQYRDQEAHARAYEDERRAQLRFGF